MKKITMGILGTVGFSAMALVYIFSRASALPVANSVADFTNEAGVHQNSREQTVETVIAKEPTKDVIVLSGTVGKNPIAETPNISLPASANLKIPFQSQAPFGNWILPYKEACEEASAIMVDAFFKNATLTAATMDSEILKLVAWEEKTFGHNLDTNAAEIARTLKDYFGHKDVQVLYEYTLDDIKKAVSNGYPVIMTLAGRELNNPNFTGLGPIYHALVVKGYVGDKFITNDPGTRNGHDYTYDAQILINANHERNNPDVDIKQGRHAIIIVKS